jgi:hypothetical protein
MAKLINVLDNEGQFNNGPNLNGEEQDIWGGFLPPYVHPDTHDYVTEIANRPQINAVELVGNKSLPDIGVDSLTNFDIENMLI